MDTASTLMLLYNGTLVGYIQDADFSQGTWSGALESVLDLSGGGVSTRIGSFMPFCEDWNERQRASNESSHCLFVLDDEYPARADRHEGGVDVHGIGAGAAHLVDAVLVAQVAA